MVFLRSMTKTNEDVIAHFNAKLSELKNELVDEIKKQILSEVKAILDKKDKKIEELCSTVAMLQEHVKVLKINVNDNEQYGRRLCLRVDGIPCAEKETAEEVLDKLKRK